MVPLIPEAPRHGAAKTVSLHKGLHRYEKQKAKVNRISEKIANQRKDFCHKMSRKIANSYNAVCVEDIDLRAMAQSLHFGKATSDNGFGIFRNFLKYKLEEQGKHYIVIDKWYPRRKPVVIADMSTRTLLSVRRNGSAIIVVF